MRIKNIYTFAVEWIYWQCQAKTKLKEDWFLCSRGIGDTIIFLSKISEYKKKYPDKKVNIIISENHVPIVNFYEKFIDKKYILPQEKMCASTQVAFRGLLPRNIKYILPISSYQMLGYKDLSIFDLMNITLELDTEAKYLCPQVSHRDISSLNILNKNKDEKYVLMAPFAVSVDNIQKDIWIKIYNLLVSKGYRVLINCSKTEKNDLFSCEDYISFPIDQIYLLAEKVELFIGLRSGMCDLLAFSKCDMVVAYPNKNGKEFLSKYTFNNMPFEKKIIECFEDELYNVVKNFIKDNE